MRRRSHQLQYISTPHYKYSFNDKTYDLALSASLNNKIGAYRAKQPQLKVIDFESTRKNQLQIQPSRKQIQLQLPRKQHPKYALDKIINRGKSQSAVVSRAARSIRTDLKLPSLNKSQFDNPESTFSSPPPSQKNSYYLGRIARSFALNQKNYLMALSRQHYIQTLEAVKTGKNMKIGKPSRQIKLHKKNPKHKTVYLDMDQTLIHCDEAASNYTVKLNFPIQGGGTISAGVRVRPHCQQFIAQLSTFAEVIIFTASSPSYADVVLDYLDPQKKYFSHRLYRHHCTLQKGFYTKDLRNVNRRLQDSVLVDNSGFSFMLQPQNGIPILPYYHYSKDKQLPVLLVFLKQLLRQDDVRNKIKDYFFWHKYNTSAEAEVKKVLEENTATL